MYRFTGIVALFCCVCLYAALAGETYLGTITSGDAGQANNHDAGTGTAFTIPPATKISIQCTADSYVTVYGLTQTPATSTNGVYVDAVPAFFLTSTPGGVSQAYVSMIPASGTGSCKVFTRLGTEN